MKKLFTKIVVAVAGFSGVLMAQQDPQFTQFMHCKLIYNPGYAGTSDAYCFNVLYRQQWVNFKGAPKTMLFSFDAPVGALPMGVGLNFMNDQIGPIKTTFLRLALSFKYPIGPGNLGIGADVGMFKLGTSEDWIVPEPGKIDNSIPGAYDNGSSNPALNKTSYDLGAGVFYQIPNSFYVGLSATHLTAQDIKSSGSPKYDVARHYYVVAGYTIKPNPVHWITPNIKIKSDAATTQMDFNLTYSYNNSLSIGVTYRLEDAVAPMIGYRVNKPGSKLDGLKIGYSYDYTLSRIKGYTSGTHEIMLGYCIAKGGKKPQTVSGNVRFLN